jgi:alkylation response protein AidB-like acyl-CoA dehydrogenase
MTSTAHSPTARRRSYFGLNAEQAAFRAAVRDWAERVVAPTAEAVDAGLFPSQALESAAQAGYMGIVVPAQYGGQGQSHLNFALFVEEVARYCASTAVTLDVHGSVGAEPLILVGTEDQKRRFLPSLAGGALLGAFALTEPEAGSDAAALRATARRDGDEYQIDGSKIFITNAGHAGLYTVLAKTDTAAGSRGISAFLVPADTPGLTVGRPQHKLGLRGSATAEVLFRQCRVPVINRLGPEGAGFRIAMLALDSGRIGISAQALGIAGAALDYVVACVSEARGGDVQALHFELADLATQVEAARQLTWEAARQCDADVNFTTTACMAKLLSTDTAMAVTTRALDLVVDIPTSIPTACLERNFRDAKATQLYEGTNQIQRMVIARRVLRS